MNFLLTLAYDGTNYCGFQVQPNGRSVAATFQDALEAVLGSRPDIKGCSRTDAGVHALGFRLNFHADTRIPPQKLYRIHNNPIDSPFDAAYYTRVPRRLDEAAMQAAAQQFVGTHDFLALCAAGSSAAAHGDTVRTITDCHVTRRGDEVDIEVTADGYLYNMVRILAGTLCEVGAGRLRAADIPAILASRDRSRAGPTLPMKKLHRGGGSPDGEPLSAGRVEYLEAARQRVRRRRLRRTAILLAALILVTLFATGAVGASIARVKDLVDTVHIALSPAVGWPQQTGLGDLTAVQPMSGSFAAMDEDACVVYSLGGTRLAGIQSGYARPALAAGKTRFVLYNRSGNELRVESRTQNLYSKTLENSIYLCAMSDTGTLAVATDSADSTARLTVYTPTMTEQLHWDMTGTQGTPVRMAFAADSRRLAVAAVTSSAGQLQANLFVLSLAQGDPVQLSSGDSVPQWLGWLSGAEQRHRAGCVRELRRGVRCGRRRARTLRPWRRQSCQRFAGRCKRRPAAGKRTGVHRRTAG